MIINKENQLREWFTRECDPIRKVIDGLDIGWGGVQRRVTREMIMQPGGHHLDVACGYGTFLAQMGWRFPENRLFGLNIDYKGAHACIHDLLSEAGVKTLLVQADARSIPFPTGAFSSISCFMGLQDIRINAGIHGVKKAMGEIMRVVEQYGYVTVVDELPVSEFKEYLANIDHDVIKEIPLTVDVKWKRHIAERAIELYADGWIAQTELTDAHDKERLFDKVYHDMKTSMEEQLKKHGFYMPFDNMRMIVFQKI